MTGRARRGDEQGAALLMVLVFGVIAPVVAFVYLLGQMQLARHNLSRPVALQARLNARSGVYWALRELAGDTAQADTLKTIEAGRDDAFNTFLFGGIRPDSAESTEVFLPLGAHPQIIKLFDDSAYGDAQLRRELSGPAFRLVSTGRYRHRRAAASALLAARIDWPPETLLYLPRGHPRDPLYPWRQGVWDSSEVRESSLREITDAFAAAFGDTGGLSLADAPLVISASSELSLVSDQVNGSLFLSGEFGNIHWRQDRTISVWGDFQVSGTARLQGLCFLVSGEVRLYDDAWLRNVSIVAGGRVLMHGKASFSGDMLSLHSIAIGGEADIVDKSSLAVVRGRRGREEKTGESGDVQATGDTALPYAVSFDEWARIDAVVAALGAAGSVRIAPGVMAKGAIYAEGEVCHEGTLAGVIRARRLSRCGAEPGAPPGIRGRQEPIVDLGEYRLPVFMGTPVVVAWYEEYVADERP